MQFKPIQKNKKPEYFVYDFSPLVDLMKNIDC